MGHCAEAIIGDIVCAFLGCSLLMVLRPSASGQFQLVGESYVHGLCDAEALLGPLPNGWKIELDSDKPWPSFVNTSTGMSTWQDPRLPPLPTGWEGIPHPEISSNTNPLFYRFKSNMSNESTESDPRLSPNALEARGVKLEKFQLI